MPAIAVQPIVLSNSKLTITDPDNGAAGGDYEAHVSQAEFQPNSPTVNWKGLGGNSFTGVGRASWNLALGFAQDHETASALSSFLYDNEGKKLHVVLAPVAGGQAWEANIYAVPGGIGGQVDTVAVASVTCPVDGKPTRVA